MVLFLFEIRAEMVLFRLAVPDLLKPLWIKTSCHHNEKLPR